ncbi:MAG: hypothetical protein C0591_02900 [Marinilabiliales bacterium]|nr:MAG: hypothetical protein C0591_02900 [Marinilabiliales bacterium]
MSIDKDSEEWLVMRYFREKYTDFPRGKLVKSESPDFILKLSRKKSIGIERTRLDYIINNNPDLWPVYLISLIEKKEEKLRLYKKKLFAKYWLLMTVEDVNLKDIHKHIRDYNFLFDDVFLFDLFSGEITEL